MSEPHSKDVAARGSGVSLGSVHRLLDDLPAFVSILSLDGTLIEANRPLLDAADLELADVRGKKFWDCYWWDYSDAVRAELRSACERAAQGEIVRHEVFARVANDSRMLIAFQIAPLYDDAGRITHLIPSGVGLGDRQRAEEQLRESEELFREMANGLPLIVWMHDAHGEQVMVNDTFCEFFGVERAEMKGGRWQMLMHPEDANGYVEQFRACVRDRRPFHAEVRVKRADGEWRWLESWGRPRFTSGGEFRGFVGTSADVTDRKRAESAASVAAERDRFRARLAAAMRPLSSPDAIERMAATQLGEYLGARRVHYPRASEGGASALIGNEYLHDAASMAGRYRVDEFPTVVRRVRAGTTLVIADVGRDDQLNDAERVALAELGTQACVVVPRMKDGDVVGVLAVHAGHPRAWTRDDVALVEEVAAWTWAATERTRAVEELQRVHGLIEGITEGTEDRIAAQDAELRYIYFNEAYRREFRRLWGRDIELGTSMIEALADWPDEQRKARGLWSRALAGESFQIEMEFGPTPEEASVYDLRFNPVRDAQGRIVGAAHIFRDITARVRVQQALRESEERLRESDRRKDDYLAMLGHELRNPLAAVRSAAELVKIAKSENPVLQRASGVLERQSAHMARLIDGLLEVSRIARGKIDLDRATLDLREVLKGMLQDRGTQIAERGLELRKDVPVEPVWVLGDQVRLIQIFDNLVGNAVKFTRAPGRIGISLHSDEECATVRVRDSGVGIRREMLTRIFEPFHQEDQDIARGSGGLGLGLALAKGLVELHRGSIEAKSAGQDRGAELTVRLPLAPAPSDALPSEPMAQKAPRRILVVEDNTDAAEMLRDLLELQGHAVEVASTGTDALGILRRRKQDVVLCDLGLPEMSGYDFARAVRADTGLCDVPLIALTGYGQPDDRNRSSEAGFDEHLTKPVALRELAEAIERTSH